MAGCARCSVARVVENYGADYVIEIGPKPPTTPNGFTTYSVYVELTGRETHAKKRRGKTKGRGKAQPKMTQEIHVIKGKRYVWVASTFSENHSLDEDCNHASAPDRLPENGYPTRLPADTPIQTIKPSKPEINEETRMWKQVKQDTQERHARWHRQNRDVLEASGLTFEDKENVLLFRSPNKPSCDFYPSTGRWKENNGTNQPIMHRGGARAFIKWYEKQVLSWYAPPPA